ncbi:MAG TPA: VOC family protein [Acidimicrobiales bacterium]|nr:VOC family protein [Acidimicrobiales bacterium]
MDRLEFLKLNHVNAIVDGYESAVDHFVGRLGLQFNLKVADHGDGVDACLLSLGPVIFELFAPRQRTERGQGRLLDLYGDHYIGAEYQVADMGDARAACAARGIRILIDPGTFFVTHPRDSFGIAWEVWDGDWHAPRPDFSDFVDVHPADYWRDEHPLGVTGLSCLRAAVDDLPASVTFFKDALGAAVVYREDRPAVAGDAVGVQFADTVIELLAPTGDGEITAFLERYGPRLRSTVFTVADLEQAQRHLASIGIPLTEGDDPKSLLLAPEHNHGLRFEISSAPRQ